MTFVARMVLASIVGLVSVTVGTLAQAQNEKAPAEKAPAEKAAAAAADAKGPAAAEYQRLFEEWKTVLKDLRKLKVQYQSAALADQAKIQQDWKDLVEKGNKTVAALEAAGVKAYTESPNED